VQINWTDGHHGRAQIEQRSTWRRFPQPVPWGPDIQRGRPDTFSRGFGETSSLWRIARVESDIAGRQMFTLAPTRMASACRRWISHQSTTNSSGVKVESDWKEVERCLANHLHSSLITAAKNVAESLVSSRLVGLQRRRRRSSLANSVRGSSRRFPFACSWIPRLPSAQQSGILHGHTHSDRVVISGRLVDPEFALTVVAIGAGDVVRRTCQADSKKAVRQFRTCLFGRREGGPISPMLDSVSHANV
jgi:hypothetical protein